MSLNYVRKNRQLLASELLGRDVFIDELGDLADAELDRLLVECDAMVKSLKEDHDDLPAGSEARIHVNHKRNIWKTYRTAARMERGLRAPSIDERFFALVAERIGAAEAETLRNKAIALASA